MADDETADDTRSGSEAPAQPVLRVVGGNPTPEELAVLTALAAAAGGREEAAPVLLRGGWRDPARQHRRPLLPGPGAWRSAAW